MKTAGSENPNSHIRLCTEPSPWGGRSKPSSLIHTGWKAGKYPAAGEVSFLTFPFIELLRTWRELLRIVGAEDNLGIADNPSRIGVIAAGRKLPRFPLLGT
jgi:hypothetical protein